MSYTKQTRTTIATPATASEELHTTLVQAYTAHFSKVLTPTLMISQRKGCYATVINATSNGVSLEANLGTINAKIATEQILAGVARAYSEVPTN